MLRTVGFLVVAFLAACGFSRATESAFTFTNVADRFVATSGPATLEPWDPDGSGWSAGLTAFGTAAEFGIVAPPGGDKVVMRFPACTNRQGYLVEHRASPNGVYADAAKVSNFTLVFDVLFPASSDAKWRALYQSNLTNSEDAEFYVRNTASGGVGINGDYRGAVTPDAWHRIVLTMRSAPGEGQLHRYIDGVFVGGLGTTGSGIDVRWALDPTFLLFTEDNNETASGYVSGIYFVDRQMTQEEVRALGGVNAAGPIVPGAAAPPLPQQLPRLTRAIGHRGAPGARPENTLPSLVKCFADGAHAIETDIRISADGQVVVFHDETVERTTDGFGAVAGMTVAELKTLDAGSWFDPAYTGTRIPTLVEYMQALPAGKILYLDIKVTDFTMVTALRKAFDEAHFSEDRWWLYVYSDPVFAQQLHAEFPNSIIVWEAIPANWQNDPTAFTTLKEIGVGGFDLGGNGGNLTPELALRMKQEGLFVATYTILDPDNMVLSSAKGADYMETDFPKTLQEITPPLSAGATMPSPPDGSIDVQPTVLSWLVGANATGHQVYFGTVNPPPLVGPQSYDLFGPSALIPGTTYYWRVTEITPGGPIAGPVWSFTTPSGVVAGTSSLFEWNFAGANLDASMGNGSLNYTDGVTPGLVAFGQTDDLFVPHIGGESAAYMHVPALTGTSNGFGADLGGSAANGGGQYINQYTVVMDIFSPGGAGWQALFQTNTGNANDADFYVSPEGALGIADLGYSPAGTFSQNAWHRIVFTVDLGAGRVTYFLDGLQVFSGTGLTGKLDGRFSIYPGANPGIDMIFFNEGDTSGQYTHELYVGAVAFLDRELTADEAIALGGPKAGGIYSLPANEAPKLTLTVGPDSAKLSWPPVSGWQLQRALTLPTWEPLPGTAGIGNFLDARAPSGHAFYRLVKP